MNASGSANDWSFAFDAYGRTTCARNAILSDACTSNNARISYAYDALDRTSTRIKGSSTTTYTYEGRTEDPFKVVGSSTTTYAYSPYGVLAQQTGTATRFFAKDPHGDIVGLVDTSSVLKGTVSYNPWGERLGTSGTETTILGFQGDVTDPETKMVDMTTRNYLPSLGRFSKRDVLFGDPQSPVSLNQFVYAGANPVTLLDPTGMAGCPSNGGKCQADPPCHPWPSCAGPGAGSGQGEGEAGGGGEGPEPIEPPDVGIDLWTIMIDDANSWSTRMDAYWEYSQRYPAHADEVAEQWLALEESRLLDLHPGMTWAEVRSIRNARAQKEGAALFVALGVLVDASGAGCEARGGGLQTCYDALPDRIETLFGGIGGITIGNTFYTPFAKGERDALGQAVVNDALLHHERIHSDWWAVMGPSSFATEYIREYRTYGRCSPLEAVAGFAGGGYTSCV